MRVKCIQYTVDSLLGGICARLDFRREAKHLYLYFFCFSLDREGLQYQVARSGLEPVMLFYKITAALALQHSKGSHAKRDKRQIYTCAFFWGKILFTLACTSWQNFTSQNEIHCSQNPFQSLGFYAKLHKCHSLHSLSRKLDKMDILYK